MLRIDSVISNTLLEPRPYQRRIATKVLDMFAGRYVNKAGEQEPAVESIMIESPTGSGKTCIALVIAKSLQSEFPDLVVGWVAMRRNLLSQVRSENSGKRINLSNFYPTSMFDSDPAELIKARQEGRKVLLVVDECVHDATASCAHLHNVVRPDFVLGMTATPFRGDRVKLCFNKVVKDAGIHQLISDGYLSQYHHYSIPDWQPTTVARFYLNEPERWGKSIFYFVDTQQCWELQRLFEREGVRSDVVVGSTSPTYREGQLDAFRSGNLDCLINCMVLTEGFDDPSLATAWVRDSSRGPTIQMSGRAFRKHPSLPVKNVVQSRLTKWPMIKTAMPQQQYLWQEEWRSLTVNPELDNINNNARMAIAMSQVKLPRWLIAKKRKPRTRRRNSRFG